MVSRISISLLCLFVKSWLSSAANNEKCSSPLGMEDESISDNQITAKTWLYFKRRDTRYYRPYFARLNYEKLSGGWCSADLGQFPGQYVEVDLMKNIKVTSIATQGRHNGQEWVEYFKIEYKRYNETRYRRYKEKGQWKVFEANKDTNSTVTLVFSRPLILQKIKIIPIGNRFTIHCMRFELYGCTWKQEKDGLISYSAPFGEIRKGTSLQDETYDGFIPLDSAGLLFRGIGKLADGVIPAKGPAYDSEKKIYTEWVGYKANPLIYFAFNSSRKFSSISFHALNKNKNLKLFEKVNIEVSEDGVKYKHIGSYLPTEEAKRKQGVLLIKFSLNGNVGQYLRCSFNLGGSWLLLGEVEFDTEPLRVMVPVHTEPSRRILTKSPLQGNYHEGNLEEQKERYDQSLENGDSSTNKNDSLSFPIILTIVLVGLVIVIALFTVIVRFIRSSRKSKRKERKMADQSKDMGTKEILEEERISLNEDL